VSESEAELARELAEELRKLKVEDVLVSVLIQISSIGYRRLGLTDETRDERDLDQSRLAIETMRALLPVLEGFLPRELTASFGEQIANLQLAYARAATATPSAEEATDRGQTPDVSRTAGDDEENR
jgi:hypothetical protein